MACGCSGSQPVGLGMMSGDQQVWRVLRSDADPVCAAVDSEGECLNFPTSVAAQRSGVLGVVRAVLVAA